MISFGDYLEASDTNRKKYDRRHVHNYFHSYHYSYDINSCNNANFHVETYININFRYWFFSPTFMKILLILIETYSADIKPYRLH